MPKEILVPVSSELGNYCRWCGMDLGKKHQEKCPLIRIKSDEFNRPFFGFKSIAWGFGFTRDQMLNLHTFRLGLLFTLTDQGLGPKDKKIAERLAIEHLRFWQQRVGEKGMKYITEQTEFFSNPSKGGLGKGFERFLKCEEKLRRMGEQIPKMTLEDVIEWIKLILFGIAVGSIVLFIMWAIGMI